MKELLQYLQGALDDYTRELQTRGDEAPYRFQYGLCHYISQTDKDYIWLAEYIGEEIMWSRGQLFLGPCYNPHGDRKFRVTRHQAFMPRIVFLMDLIRELKLEAKRKS